MSFHPMINDTIRHEWDKEPSSPAAVGSLDEAVDAVFVMLRWVFCIGIAARKSTKVKKNNPIK